MIVQWEFLYKNHIFATHILDLFFISIKVLIHFAISSSWVHICKGKLFGHQLQGRNVTNKPNLDVILHFDLGYLDHSRLCISPNYLNCLRKDVFAMI